MYALYALAITTGARLGELLALQRGDASCQPRQVTRWSRNS
jgi:integrase